MILFVLVVIFRLIIHPGDGGRQVDVTVHVEAE